MDPSSLFSFYYLRRSITPIPSSFPVLAHKYISSIFILNIFYLSPHHSLDLILNDLILICSDYMLLEFPSQILGGNLVCSLKSIDDLSINFMGLQLVLFVCDELASDLNFLTQGWVTSSCFFRRTAYSASFLASFYLPSFSFSFAFYFRAFILASSLAYFFSKSQMFSSRVLDTC